MFFTAITLLALTGSSFASNEIITKSSKSNLNELLIVSENKISEDTSKDIIKGKGYGVCNTVTYKRPIGTTTSESLGMDGQVYTTTTFTYEITGQCKTCAYIGGTTTECWGYGY